MAFLQSPNMGVSENNGTPKSSILIGFSIINHPFWGTPIFGNTHICWVVFHPLHTANKQGQLVTASNVQLTTSSRDSVDKILHQLIGSSSKCSSHYLQGFIHFRWWSPDVFHQQFLDFWVLANLVQGIEASLQADRIGNGTLKIGGSPWMNMMLPPGN